MKAFDDAGDTSSVKKTVVDPSSPSSFLDRPVPGLTIGTSFVIWLGLTTLIVPHYVLSNNNNNNKLNILAYSILFFNNLNILISVCEIMLGKHIAFIKQHYLRLKKHYTAGVDEYQAAFGYLTMPLSIRESLFLCQQGQQKWAQMWSTYALWDPSYQNDESFGFFIDVGNGWSTIPINLIWNVMIVCPQCFTGVHETGGNNNNNNTTILLLGFLGTASYWQVLYGTIIYLLSFVWNKRYQNKPLIEVLGFVGFANGLWFVFPIFCLYASYQLLATQDPTEVFYYK